MSNTDRLYEAFGELLYVVAMADGQVQAEEKAALAKKLSGHPWGANIQWSFDYELRKDNDIEDLYQKVIDNCERFGPSEAYTFLIELMEEVAQASSGVDENEQKVMDSFVHELTERFRKDIDRINQS